MIPGPAQLFDYCVEMNDRSASLRLVAQGVSYNVITAQDAKRFVTGNFILGFIRLYQTVNTNSLDISCVKALYVSCGDSFGTLCCFVVR